MNDLDPDRARRRIDVAGQWSRAIGRTVYVPMSPAEREEFLLGLVHRLGDAARAEPFDPSPGTDIGTTLVAAGFTGPDSLRSTMRILSSALLEPPLRDEPQTVERGIELLSCLAAGYAARMRTRSLDQQEDLKKALLVAVREAERREQAAEERFMEVFSSAAIGVALSDMDGTVVRVNPAMAKILEQPAESLTGQPVRAFFAQHDADDVLQSYQSVIDGELSRVNERRRMLRSDGTIAWVYLVISLLRDEHGHPAYCITMVENLSELQALQNQLGHQSVHDMLTNIGNRQHFEAKLDAMLETAQPDTTLTLLHLGLDSFSVINNGLGHEVGDRLLQAIANKLKVEMAPFGALVARVGGDEFAILVENTPATPDFQELITEINDLLAEPIYVGEHGVAACASIGVVEHVGRPVGRPDLLAAANSAMHRAKAIGKRQWLLHHPPADASETMDFALSASVPGAWENGEIGHQYQPVIRLTDNSIAALEMQLCWRHPRVGTIGHHRCVELTELSGMSLTVVPWALQNACEETRELLSTLDTEHAETPVTLRIRLTPLQTADGDLVAMVNRVIANTGMPLDRIELALDTRTVVESRGEARDNLDTLADIGIGTALHGFSGSYQEFAMVEEHDVRSVLLTCSMAARRTSAPDSPLTKAVVDIVRSLQRRGTAVTVVEVPDEREAGWWHAAGVDLAQGDHFGQPAELDVLLDRPAPTDDNTHQSATS